MPIDRSASAAEFFARHTPDEHLHLGEVARAAASGDCAVRVLESSTPASTLLSSWELRLQNARRYDSEHARSVNRDLEQLCQARRADVQARFNRWWFKLPDGSNVVAWENSDTTKLVACVKTIGKDHFSHIEWDALWGRKASD